MSVSERSIPRSSWLLLLCAASSSTLVCAQDLSGHWTGELVQGKNSRFFIEMDLVADAGRITGTSHIVLPSHRQYYAFMAVEGEMREGRFHLRETSITEQRFGNFRWCEKSGALALDTMGRPWRLSGAWRSPGCVPGELVLFKTSLERVIEAEVIEPIAVMPERLEGRKVRWTATLEAGADSLMVLLHDDVRMDGDTVSLYLNGRCVARNVAVPHRASPRAIPIRLMHGTNYLVMHAENLGSEPPNTAALVLWVEGEKQEIVLRSSLRRSGGLRIEFRP